MTTLNLELLSDAQAAATRQALDEEAASRRHIVVYLSGSHAYGFPSPDSDVDLKAVHIAPTAALVGLSPPTLHKDRLEVLSGIEIDYTSNELGPVLRGILGGNGNYLERILGTTTIASSPEHQALQPLVRAVLSQKVYRHYAGFAKNQRHAATKAEAPRAKHILYVVRTALTGIHLLKTGELVIDVRDLLDEYGMGDARELIAIKQAGERTGLGPDLATAWSARVDALLEQLDQARDSSCLPAQPHNVEALDDWLQAVRRAAW